MIEKLPTLAQLVRQLQHVPYLASKNLYRVADYIVKMDPQKAHDLSKAIVQAKEQIEQCPQCCVWKERSGSCVFCSAKDRDSSTICVVETWQELLAIEKTGGYQGLYHVLGGAISPLEGVGPEDLTVEQLVRRVNNPVAELILAMNQTPEGEATAVYIANKFKGSSIKITSLARGVPVGSSLEYMDRLTVYKALSERRAL